MNYTLAIDAALKTGWAHSMHSGGVVTLPNGSLGKRLAYFADWLDGVLQELRTDRVVYEMPFFKGKAATELGYGYKSEINRLAYCHECEVIGVAPTTLKKHATGNYRAQKFEMLAAARAMHPTIKIEDDNHCDALWLLHWSEANP